MIGDLLRGLTNGHTVTLADITVLSPQNDPFRLDTAANHDAGRAAAQWEAYRAALADKREGQS
jgi:hypothetical protein